MSDFHADLASLSDCFGDFETSYEDRRRMSYAFVKTYHATIQQNAEDVKEWEEFGRQIEKRLRHNDLGLVGGYPEMIDVLLGMAKRLNVLEKAIENRMQRAKDADHLQEQVTLRGIRAYAAEILREGEPHDQA